MLHDSHKIKMPLQYHVTMASNQSGNCGHTQNVVEPIMLREPDSP